MMVGGIILMRKVNKESIMKKTLLLSMLLTPIAFADDVSTMHWDPKPLDPTKTRGQEIIEWHQAHPGKPAPLTQQEKEYFKSQGLPIPGDTIKVKSMHSIKMNDDAKSHVLKYITEQQQNGYSQHFSKNAQNLIDMPKVAQQEFEHYDKASISDESTHLRRQSYDLKMSYNYKPIPLELTQEVIGFAPESNFSEKGWNGIVEFFKWDVHESICAFHEVNIKYTGSSGFFPQEIIRYDIHNKLTLVSAEGNDESRYLYTVEWWDNTYKRILECTAPEYSNSIKKDVISLASYIDDNR